MHLNKFFPKRDQHLVSPYIFNLVSSCKVRRLEQIINLRMSRRFPELATSQECNYSWTPSIQSQTGHKNMMLIIWWQGSLNKQMTDWAFAWTRIVSGHRNKVVYWQGCCKAGFHYKKEINFFSLFFSGVNIFRFESHC